MANLESIKFEFLKDTPVGQDNDGLFDFYHGNIAPALKDILENNTCVHTIGLFGKWGTGKSTIVEIMQRDLSFPVFVFDAWKYQDDALRRIFLIKFVDFLIDKNEPIDRSILEPLYKGTEERRDVPVEIGVETVAKKWWQKTLEFIKKNWLFILASTLLIVWVVLDTKFGDRHIVLDLIRNFSAAVASISLLGIIFKPVIEKAWEQLVNHFVSSLTPAAKMKIKIEREECLNSPEQFEKLFGEIVEKINKKIVIVFDNIDRVQGDVAIRILSTIKTFLDPINTTGLVFVIPCDSEAIAKQIRNYYGIDVDKFDSSEYLRKLFNVVIWNPEYIDADLQSYTEELLKKTGSISDYINSEDVALVINSALTNNPRQIKQFINNLIAATVIANKTNVWDTIKNNIPYLAKVLVLKEHFPDAYELLKERWYDPQNIIDSPDDSGLKEFMLKTSRITVLDAEPFLYFKEPVTSSQLSKSNEIRQSLIEANIELATTLISSEQNKEAVAKFTCDLLSKYNQQQKLLLKIFNTHLRVFHNTGIKSTKRDYYDCVARTIDNDLWQSYIALPSELIFSDILESNRLDSGLKRKLIDRYILCLNDDGTKKDINTAKDIIRSFVAHQSLLTPDDKAMIAGSIEEYYIFPDILLQLETADSQQLFLSSGGFDKYLKTIKIENLAPNLPILMKYKEYISNNKALDLVCKMLISILHSEFTINPDTRPEKEQSMRFVTEILRSFKDELASISEEVKSDLVLELTQTFSGISSPSARWICLESLRLVLPISSPEKQTEIISLTSNFFLNTTAGHLENVFSTLGVQDIADLLTQFLDQLLPRLVNEQALLDYIYKVSNNSQKTTIIKYLIDQQNDLGIQFVSTLVEIPDRVAVLKYLLSKLATVQVQNRVGAYNFVPTQIRDNDTDELKNIVVTQIKEMLKTNDPEIAKIGYDFFIKCEFLGNEKQREISRDILAYLRDPATSFTSVHAYIAKSISHCFTKLSETVKKDYIYTLFDVLRSENDHASILMALGLLDEVKPQYSIYKTDYDDLLDRLKAWNGADDDMRLIREHINSYKSKNPKKEEQAYWNIFNTLNAVD